MKQQSSNPFAEAGGKWNLDPTNCQLELGTFSSSNLIERWPMHPGSNCQALQFFRSQLSGSGRKTITIDLDEVGKCFSTTLKLLSITFKISTYVSLLHNLTIKKPSSFRCLEYL